MWIMVTLGEIVLFFFTENMKSQHPAKRQKVEGGQKAEGGHESYQSYQLCYEGFCNPNASNAEANKISDGNDPIGLQFLLKFTSRKEFYQRTFESNTTLVPDLARVAGSYLSSMNNDERVKIQIYVKGLPKRGWVCSTALAAYLKLFTTKSPIGTKRVKVPDDQPPVKIGDFELQPWQVASANQILRVLSHVSKPDPKFNIICYGNVSMNLAGWMSQQPGISLPFKQPDVEIKLAVMKEDTGVGKTNAALYFSTLFFSTTSTMEQPLYIDGRQFLPRRMVVFAPCDTLKSWEKSVRDIFPRNVRCVTFFNERSLKNLSAVLGTHHEGITVLIVSFDLLFCAKVTPKPTRTLRTQANSMDLFTNVEFPLAIVDEAHNLLCKQNPNLPLKHQRDNQFAINRNVSFFKHYCNAQRYLMLSASITKDNLTLHQCLALGGAKHSIQGPLVSPQPFPATSAKDTWRSHHTPDFAHDAKRILAEENWICTGAKHSSEMVNYCTMEYREHPLFNKEELKKIVPSKLLHRLQRLFREIPYKQGDPHAFQHLFDAINGIDEFHPNTTTPNPLYPFKSALMNLFVRTSPLEIGDIITDVSYQKHNGGQRMCTRFHALMNAIGVIWKTKPKSAILVYDPGSHNVQPLRELILDAGIPCILQIGNKQRVEKALREFETQEKSCVMIIGKNHTEGTNMPKLTHVLVVDAKNMVESDLQQVVGRGTRFGRKGQVTVVYLNGV